MSKHRSLALMAALSCLVASTTVSAGTISTSTSYTFTGACVDCPGTGAKGIGTLILDGYTLGTAFIASNFVSFSYISNVVSFSFNASTGGVAGSLPVSLPNNAELAVGGRDPSFPGIQWAFTSHANGTWNVFGQSQSFDTGTGGIWSLAGGSAVPEPLSSLGLMAGGLLALVARKRLRG